MTTGLTERHKERTHRELASAAARLFLERGYAATTVQDIAEAADVSPRTFFRYFPSKEDTITAIVGSSVDDIIDHLETHPEDLVLRVALGNALGVVASQVRRDLDASRAFRKLLSTTPALHGRWLEEQRRSRNRLAGALGPWFGGPPAPLRAHLAAGSAQLAVEIAVESWAADSTAGDPQRHLDEALTLLDAPLFSARRKS
jgi:AcrR family transcriptional regulator